MLEVDAKCIESSKRDHSEQSDLLTYVVARVNESACPAELFARTMVIFADLLREDMRSEEAQMLIPHALRDCEIGLAAGMG